jgi:hypothetical protein
MTQLIFTRTTTELVTNSAVCVTLFKLLQLPTRRLNSGPFSNQIIVAFVGKNAKEFEFQARL